MNPSAKPVAPAVTRPSSEPMLSGAANPWVALGPAPVRAGETLSSPAPVAGRVTSLALSGGTLYAGTAGGGVWSTTDNGAHWHALSDSLPSSAIGCLAVDPSNPATIYAGTGEMNFSYDSYFGRGILKTTNSGKTWSVIGASFFTGHYISSIVIDPNHPNTLYVSDDAGVYRSQDGGFTWTKVLDPSNFPVVGLVMSPTDSATVYALVGLGGIYKTTDSGQVWTLLTGGLPTKGFGVMSLAVNPANSQQLYASFAQDAALGHDLLGMYTSSDGGATWSLLPNVPPYFDRSYSYGGPPGKSGQGQYDNVLAVDPANPAHIFAGGITLVESSNGGAHWINLATPGQTGFAVALHPDQHALLFDAKGDLFVGNDGGVWEMTAAGVWKDISGNLNITQFYPGLSVSPYGSLAGGTQDNGTVQYQGAPAWAQLIGGDGGFTALDPAQPQTQYTEYIHGGVLFRSKNGGVSFTSGSPNYKDQQAIGLPMPLAVSRAHPSDLWLGADRVYKSTDRGASWTAVSPVFPAPSGSRGDPLTALTQAQSGSILYAGTLAGRLFASFDAGKTWTNITPAYADPAASVTSITPNPANPRQITVTYGGYDYPANAVHVLVTPDAANARPAWQNVTGNLPLSPVDSSLALGDQIYVGTDQGVYTAARGSANWTLYGQLLPHTPVVSLAASGSGRLIAATHGRGVWETASPVPDALAASTGTMWLRSGQSAALRVYSQGVDVTRYASWTASNGHSVRIARASTAPHAASVGTAVQVVALQPGSSVLTATYDGAMTQIGVTVQPIAPGPQATILESTPAIPLHHIAVQISHKTAYLPISAVASVLQQLGLNNSWSVRTHSWVISDQSLALPPTAAPLRGAEPGLGATVYINGAVAATGLPILQAGGPTRPSEHQPSKSQSSIAAVTSTATATATATAPGSIPAQYIAIWYVDRLLTRFGLHSSWSVNRGTHTYVWTVAPGPAVSDPVASRHPIPAHSASGQL